MDNKRQNKSPTSIEKMISTHMKRISINQTGQKTYTRSKSGANSYNVRLME